MSAQVLCLVRPCGIGLDLGFLLFGMVRRSYLTSTKSYATTSDNNVTKIFSVGNSVGNHHTALPTVNLNVVVMTGNLSHGTE